MATMGETPEVWAACRLSSDSSPQRISAAGVQKAREELTGLLASMGIELYGDPEIADWDARDAYVTLRWRVRNA